LDYTPWREVSRPSFYRPPSNAPNNDELDEPQLAVELNRNDADFFKAFE
jgi:hypothetical protein